jgi:hypothetical protein
LTLLDLVAFSRLVHGSSRTGLSMEERMIGQCRMRCGSIPCC